MLGQSQRICNVEYVNFNFIMFCIHVELLPAITILIFQEFSNKVLKTNRNKGVDWGEDRGFVL